MFVSIYGWTSYMRFLFMIDRSESRRWVLNVCTLSLFGLELVSATHQSFLVKVVRPSVSVFLSPSMGVIQHLKQTPLNSMYILYINLSNILIVLCANWVTTFYCFFAHFKCLLLIVLLVLYCWVQFSCRVLIVMRRLVFKSWALPRLLIWDSRKAK